LSVAIAQIGAGQLDRDIHFFGLAMQRVFECRDPIQVTFVTGKRGRKHHGGLRQKQ
jgi:hypothetical protein